jgi:hypothetical protein
VDVPIIIDLGGVFFGVSYLGIRTVPFDSIDCSGLEVETLNKLVRAVTLIRLHYIEQTFLSNIGSIITFIIHAPFITPEITINKTPFKSVAYFERTIWRVAMRRSILELIDEEGAPILEQWRGRKKVVTWLFDTFEKNLHIYTDTEAHPRIFLSLTALGF